MAFVLDASVAVAWAFKENHPLAEQTLARLPAEEAITPALWWFELRNVLVVNERRGRITEAGTAAFLRTVARLPIATDRTPVEDDVLALARRHRLTVYDAAYLELARRLAAPLATLDAALATAAAAEGVTLDRTAS
jgi:predicted nucleic acid-binding protein